MADALNKISAYELFTIFFPGVLTVGYSLWILDIKILDGSISQYAFMFCVAYLCGIVISRLGSILIQPLARKIRFIDWSSGYYAAEKKDGKISILQKDFNMYRSLVVAILICIVLTIYSVSCENLDEDICVFLIIFLVLLLIVSLFSYRKQSKYITERINAVKKMRGNSV